MVAAAMLIAGVVPPELTTGAVPLTDVTPALSPVLVPEEVPEKLEAAIVPTAVKYPWSEKLNLAVGVPDTFVMNLRIQPLLSPHCTVLVYGDVALLMPSVLFNCKTPLNVSAVEVVAPLAVTVASVEEGLRFDEIIVDGVSDGSDMCPVCLVQFFEDEKNSVLSAKLNQLYPNMV